MQQYALELALEKAGLHSAQLDYFLGGDLLNQIIATSFTARAAGVPYFGLYGACSSLAEGMILGSCLLDGGFGKLAAVCTSSHHDAAERQLRYPTEMGVQRTLSAQWTVTGSGAYFGAGLWQLDDYRRGAGEDCRQRHQQQLRYGLGYGSGSGGYHCGLVCRYGRTTAVGLHCNRRFGQNRL